MPAILPKDLLEAQIQLIIVGPTLIKKLDLVDKV